jgi:hypothetical protein
VIIMPRRNRDSSKFPGVQAEGVATEFRKAWRTVVDNASTDLMRDAVKVARARADAGSFAPRDSEEWSSVAWSEYVSVVANG